MSADRLAQWLPLLRDTLAREGRFRWRVEGGSMVPTLPPGCEIEIAPLPARVPLGSVVVFVGQDALVAHRLVRRTRGRWVTQGDARATPDRPIEAAQALGWVVAAYQDGRRCWPPRFAGATAWRWLLRYHRLRLQRWMARLQ